MNLLDLGIIVILVLMGLRGYWRGLLQEVSVLVGLVIGLILAAHYYLQLARVMGQWIHTPLYSRIVSFLIILVLTYWVIRLSGNLLHRFFTAILLGQVDKVLGGLFAVLKGGVVLGFLLTVLGLVVPKDSKLLQESLTAPYMQGMYQQVLILLPQEFKDQVRARALQFEREWGGRKQKSQTGKEV